MKYILIWVLLAVIQISPSLKAEDFSDCFIMAGFDYPDPGYKSPRRSLSKVLENGRMTSMEETVEECFQRAITFCSQFPTYASLNIENDFNKMYDASVLVRSHVYCKWEFNDGYIDDSSGLVTKYTNKNSFAVDDTRVNFNTSEYDQ